MPLSAAVLAYIADSALDWYLNKKSPFHQTIQQKPLISKIESNAITFPGGSGNISVAVRGAYGAGGVNDTLKGFTADDTVSFYNPANHDRLLYVWREMHLGIGLTFTELKHDGITVSNAENGTGQTNHTKREETALINMWQDKLFDLGEQYARSLNGLYWGDGTADALGIHGLRHFLVEDPSIGTVGGMNRATAANAFIRNRARTAAFGTKVGTTPALSAHGGDAVTSTPANGGALIQVLQEEYRQLRRYGGNPNCFMAGSDFIGAYETEIRANGNYSERGFTGSQDGAMGPILFNGQRIVYDPTLDDLGLEKRGYWWDDRHIMLAKMDKEWKRTYNPARPHDQFVLHRSITNTGQMVAKQLNSGLVIDIA
ncbi:MAG: phage major capsid protein [Pseudomonadota bacterium]